MGSEMCIRDSAGLAPFGTTGEALSVGNKDRINSLEELIKSGIDPSVLIPGTGLCNLPDTISLSQHAISLGCHGIMTLPPFYFKDMDGGSDRIPGHLSRADGINVNSGHEQSLERHHGFIVLDIISNDHQNFSGKHYFFSLS